MLVIPKFQLGNNLTQGVLWGILSGFTYAILSMLNRKYVKEYSSSIITFYEQFIATIVLIPFLFLQKLVFQLKDVFLLVLLGIVFTGISHSLFISGLKNVKTQIAGIISSLEPVYGIIFATFLLREIPTLRDRLGSNPDFNSIEACPILIISRVSSIVFSISLVSISTQVGSDTVVAVSFFNLLIQYFKA